MKATNLDLVNETPYFLFNKTGVKFNEKFLDNIELVNNKTTIINGVKFKAHAYNDDEFYFSVKMENSNNWRSNTSQLRKL